MTTYPTIDALLALVGQETGVSEWLTVDQARIDAFADATGDRQWIHVDPVQAAAGPFGATIAHGFLTLSLLPHFLDSAYRVEGLRMGINYGLNKVRFIAPVRVGSQLRGRFKLRSAEPLADGGVQVISEVTIELRDSDKPACVAESVARLFT